VKPRDNVLILRKPGGLTSFPCEGVSTDLDRAIADQWLGLDLSASERTSVNASTNKRARDVRDLGARWTNRPGPAAVCG
jgi:hypothetical protein